MRRTDVVLCVVAGASAEHARAHDNAGLATRERDPPRTSLSDREYDDVSDAKGIIMPLEEMVWRTFLFRPQEISVIQA
jgi:hypothetical protein